MESITDPHREYRNQHGSFKAGRQHECPLDFWLVHQDTDESNLHRTIGKLQEHKGPLEQLVRSQYGRVPDRLTSNPFVTALPVDSDISTERYPVVRSYQSIMRSGHKDTVFSRYLRCKVFQPS
jgi:hypothetical protein